MSPVCSVCAGTSGRQGIEVKAKLGDGRRRASLVNHQAHLAGGDGGESAELLLADDPAGGDGAPLAVRQNLNVVGLHALAEGDVFLDARDIKGSVNEVVMFCPLGFFYAAHNQIASTVLNMTFSWVTLLRFFGQ